MARQFEKEVFLKAPVERVWQALTTPEQMAVWMGGHTVITFEPRVGGKVHIEGLFPGEVAVFEPPYRFGWRWDPDNGTEPAEETLTLYPEDGGTRLHLLSICCGRWADKLMYFGGMEAGWLDWLEALESLVHTGTAQGLEWPLPRPAGHLLAARLARKPRRPGCAGTGARRATNPGRTDTSGAGTQAGVAQTKTPLLANAKGGVFVTK